MKKNIDQTTAALFTAAKNEYLRNYSELLKSSICANITVDQVAALLNKKKIDGVKFSDDVKFDTIEIDTHSIRCGVLGSVVRLVDGYSCSVEALPRIYKQLARLVGEKVETIAVGPRPMLAYGFTADALKDKGNKKIINVLKKYCKKGFNEAHGYAFHDPARRCVVWTDAHIMIISPALYNPEAAGYMYDAKGVMYPAPVVSAGQNAPQGEYFRYPNYAAAVPDYNECYSIEAARLVKNMAAVLPFAPAGKYSVPIMYAARLEGKTIGVNARYKTAFDAMPGRVYMSHPSRPFVAPLGADAAAGCILVMPCYVDQEPDDNDLLYINLESSQEVRGVVPVADADTLAPMVPPVVADAAPAVDAEPVAPAADTPATPATLTDAEVLEAAARIRANYDDMRAQAAADAAAAQAAAAAAFAEAITAYCDSLTDTPAPQLPPPPAVVYISGPVPPSPRRRSWLPRPRRLLARLGRVAALLVLPLLVLLLGGSSAATTPDDAAADNTLYAAAVLKAVEVTAPAPADDAAAIYQARELPPVTVTAPRPASQKNVLTPANQKTAPAVAAVPTADDDAADTLTDAPTAPTPSPTPADGITVCAGTPWAYTMMNWA